MKNPDHPRRIPCLMMALLLSGVAANARGAAVALEDRLPAMHDGPAILLRAAEDARSVTSPDGPGFEPVHQGPACRAAVPAALSALRRGTIALRLKASRRVGFVGPEEKPRTVRIIDAPFLRVELREHRDCPHILVSPPAGADGRALCRIAYLEPDRWYHFAVSWNADTGDTDVFLNGWAQQQIHLPAWEPEPAADTVIQLGGILGDGEDQCRFAVAGVKLHGWALDEARLRTELADTPLFDVGPAARRRLEDPLDLSGYRRTLLYQADFTDTLPIVAENNLFEGEERVRQPAPDQWVLEGPGEAYTEDGDLVIDNLTDSRRNHVVLWLPRVFPDRFLLEFDITIEEAGKGLAIVFFAARPQNDPLGSIFARDLPKRDGLFRNYIRGAVNSYHISYLAANHDAPTMRGVRRTANLRKNSGFWLTACGDDQIQEPGLGRGPHHVRLLKDGSKIRLEANGRMSVVFDDDGTTWGPVWTDGYIGLRQMNHLKSARYRNLRVYEIR